MQFLPSNKIAEEFDDFEAAEIATYGYNNASEGFPVSIQLDESDSLPYNAVVDVNTLEPLELIPNINPPNATYATHWYFAERINTLAEVHKTPEPERSPVKRRYSLCMSGIDMK
jgi:hypothetical protein